MQPTVYDKLRQFGYLVEHVITQLLWKDNLAPFLLLGTNHFVGIRKDEQGDDAQLVSALKEVANCCEVALVGRVERSRKEKDLISPIVAESRPSGEEVWLGGMVLSARGRVEEAYRVSGGIRTAQNVPQIGLHCIWTLWNVLTNKRCRI
jgi:hypothetical protein